LQLTARAEGHRPQQEQRPWPADTDRVEVDFVLTPAATLRGVVLDQDGRPVAAARVWLDAQSEPGTDAQGRFAIADAPASQSLWLQGLPPEPAADWGPARDLAVTTADSPITVQLERLPRGNTALLVDLQDDAGGPLEARRVHLLRDGGQRHDAQPSIGRVTAQ